MTTNTTRTHQPQTAGNCFIRNHSVTGTPAQLANIVTNHNNAGTLIGISELRPLAGGRLLMVIRLRENQKTRPNVRVTSAGEYARTYRTRRNRRTRTTVLAITSTAVGLAAVAAFLIGQLVELIATHAAMSLGIFITLVFTAIAATRRRSGNRRHCPGC